MFSKILTKKYMKSYLANREKLYMAIQKADGIVIGAGSGLSTSAGLTYSGERFEKIFSDFIEKYKIKDMYSGGFYPYSSLEEYWGWWSRHIFYNRYVEIPKDTYQKLYELVKDKDYFVITTNVDHCFQRAGFDKRRLFYMQGDYGLFQCSKGCHQKTYDNQVSVIEMIEKQKNMCILSELIPRCPHCEAPMVPNLRCDDTFVQDEGWYQAKKRYEDFIHNHKGMNMVYLELGVDWNAPIWIKYPFWKMTEHNKKSTYVCINYEEAIAPKEISNQSICMEADIHQVLEDIGQGKCLENTIFTN